MHDSEKRSQRLLAQLTWTRRLAAELVADAGLAEDLVQDAWVEYLTRPPRAGGSLRGWFAQVMRNRARQHGRRARRGAELERERATSEAAGEATVELVARAQAQRALVDAVLALEAPCRDVVMLRYFEELDSPAIAEKLGLPPSTVRNHLQRGLAQLRARLERGKGRGASTWLSALLPLLQRPEPTTVSAPATPALTTPGAWAPTLGPWAVAAVLAAAAVAVGLFVLERPRTYREPAPAAGRVALLEERTSAAPSAPEVQATSAREDTPARAADARVEGTEARASAANAAPAQSSAEAPSTVVEVRIDGVPATRGLVHLLGGAEQEELARELDAEGRAVFEGVLRASGTAAIAPYPGATILQRSFRGLRPEEPVVLELGTARLEGHLWDADGRPVAGQQVILGMKIGYDYGALAGYCVTAPDGRFTFDALPAADYWLHSSHAGPGGQMRSHGELALGEVREVALGSPRGRVRWSGRIVDGDGNVLREPGQELSFASTADGSQRVHFPAEMEPDGRYSVELVPGEYEVRRRASSDSSTQLLAARVTVGADEQRDLTLRGASVRGTAYVTGRGTPYDGTDQQLVLRLVRAEDDRGPAREYDATVDPDGRFLFAGLEPGRWLLTHARLAENGPVLVLLTSDSDRRAVDVLVR